MSLEVALNSTHSSCVDFLYLCFEVWITDYCRTCKKKKNSSHAFYVKQNWAGLAANPQLINTETEPVKIQITAPSSN